MKKISAFTLSEVMITVGIIGVIAALTVPNLVKNYQRQAQTVQLRKTINEIESAIDMYITEEGKTSLAHTNFANDGGVDDFFQNHLRVVKTCASADTSSCFASENYMSIDGTKNQAFSCKGSSYVLADSSVVCANRIGSVSVEAEKDGNKIKNAFKLVTGLNVELYIDTNGSQPPNIGGRDMFHVYIRPDGRIADTAQTDNNVCTLNDLGQPVCVVPEAVTIKPRSACTSSAFGTSCLARLLDSNWNMDY